jgi:hypothetical protein
LDMIVKNIANVNEPYHCLSVSYDLGKVECINTSSISKHHSSASESTSELYISEQNFFTTSGASYNTYLGRNK